MKTVNKWYGKIEYQEMCSINIADKRTEHNFDYTDPVPQIHNPRILKAVMEAISTTIVHYKHQQKYVLSFIN